ncbi:UbiA family prenyltransferase [bacterium]|nr:UbiA family prenyltransferase [bacterium]
MKKIIQEIVDSIAFIRPLLLIPIWTPAIIGFWNGGGNKGIGGEWELILLTTFLGAGIYGINQLFDIEGDKINNKNIPFALGFLSPMYVKSLIFASFLGALIVAFPMGITLNLLVILGLILGIVYSAPPIRLKDRTIYALIANGFGHGMLIYLIGYAFALDKIQNARWDWFVILRALAYGIAYSSVYLFTTVPDIDGDRKVGKITFAVRYGERKTMALGLLGIFLAGATGLAFKETALFLTAIVSLPFYFAALSSKEIEPKLIVRANKIAVLILALFACFYIPTFIVPIALAIAFAAIYNRVRLGVRYP